MYDTEQALAERYLVRPVTKRGRPEPWTSPIDGWLVVPIRLIIVVATQADIIPRVIRRLLVTGVRVRADG